MLVVPSTVELVESPIVEVVVVGMPSSVIVEDVSSACVLLITRKMSETLVFGLK